MNLHLAGAAVLIVGASRGLGLAAAEAFADEGAKLAIAGRDGDRLANAAESLRSRGAWVWSEPLDATNGEATHAWTNRAAAAAGGLDALIFAPGGHELGNTPRDWALNLALDISGSAAAIEAARPHLSQAVARRGDASIILVASAAALLSYGPSAYGPLKAGLVNLCTGYALLLAPEGIRVNAVSPGRISTSATAHDRAGNGTPEDAERHLDQIPLRRFGRPEEVGRAIAFLASPVSGFTSGANLRLDGAMTARVDFG